MRGYKELLNSVSHSWGLREMSEYESVQMKRCLLEMYQMVFSICQKNGLCLMLTGGSVLGAVRHQGFIPWDDDMDLGMPRVDYDKFLTLIEAGALGDKYEFTYPSKEHDSPSAFLKIYRKGTKIIRIEGEDSKYPQGIDLDVFPIEGVPSSKVARWWRDKCANCLRLIANVVDEAQPWSEEKKRLYGIDKKFCLFMRCRQLMGKFFSVINHKQWICWYDEYVRNSRQGQFSSIPTGRKMYEGETLPSSVFFPTSKGIFEGIEVNLPANPDVYLRNLYGDYMQIPSVEKRERHLITKIVFDGEL